MIGTLPEEPCMPAPAVEPVIARVFRKLGGQQALGTNISSEADLARIVDRGVRLAVLGHLERAGFSRQELERLVIPARTWRHRKNKRQPLSTEESDRVVRFARVQAQAED